MNNFLNQRQEIIKDYISESAKDSGSTGVNKYLHDKLIYIESCIRAERNKKQKT